jgi:hypothetical protein
MDRQGDLNTASIVQFDYLSQSSMVALPESRNDSKSGQSPRSTAPRLFAVPVLRNSDGETPNQDLKARENALESE